MKLSESTKFNITKDAVTIEENGYVKNMVYGLQELLLTLIDAGVPVYLVEDNGQPTHKISMHENKIKAESLA